MFYSDAEMSKDVLGELVDTSSLTTVLAIQTGQFEDWWDLFENLLNKRKISVPDFLAVRENLERVADYRAIRQPH